MAAERFVPGNRFSDVVSVAAAAVEWQGLSPAEQDLVVVEEGIPYLAGVPDLSSRAEAIADAAERRAIVGFTHSEDGYSLPVGRMRLYRDSVDTWVKKSDRRRPAGPPASAEPSNAAPEQLLRLKDVLDRLGIGRSTLYRWMDAGDFERPHFDQPARWRRSYLDSFTAPKNEVKPDDI